MTELRMIPSLTTAAVDAITAAARRAATEHGGAFAVAVVDHTTTAVALFRSDTADPLTAGLAIGKARLVAGNGQPTRIWRELVAADPFLGAVGPLALDRIVGGAVLFAGGYPLVVGGTVIGGVGVSGGTEAQDDRVARAGLAALGSAEQFADGSAVRT